MLSEHELEIVGEWEKSGIIVNLTQEDLAIFAGDKVAFCTCSDGRTDTCCHKRRLKKSLVAEAQQAALSGKFLSKVNHEHDPNRWYGGPAVFAESYRGFNKKNAIFRRDHEVKRGMEIRGVDDWENIFHWICGMLRSYNHKLEDVLVMAKEAHEFMLEGMEPHQRVHSYLHIRKICPTCEDIKQRIFKFYIA